MVPGFRTLSLSVFIELNQDTPKATTREFLMAGKDATNTEFHFAPANTQLETDSEKFIFPLPTDCTLTLMHIHTGAHTHFMGIN